MTAMLATSKIPDINKISYPKWVSPKLDGIRCRMVGGMAVSRTAKLLPSPHIQRCLSGLHGLDGEIMLVNDDCELIHDAFNDVQSHVMAKRDHKFKFNFVVFDSFLNPEAPFHERNAEAMAICKASNNVAVRHLTHWTVKTPEDLVDIMDNWVEMGYEGLIIRDPNGPYKNGRATMKQEWMMKYKYFQDDEGIIVGFEELMHNADTSTHKLENQVPGDTLGKFLVRWNGKIIPVGGGEGVTQELRKQWWDNRPKLLGKPLTFKFQGLTPNGFPRFPTIKGPRDIRF